MSKRKSRGKRSNSDYIASAKRLAAFAPSLKKYSRRKSRLSSHEKAAIARKENLLRFTDHLYPVSKELARQRKNELWVPDIYKYILDEKGNKTKIRTPGRGTQGIRAMKFINTGDVKSIKVVGKDLLLVSNGREWIYQSIHQRDNFKSALKTTAQKAFEQPEQYDIEKLTSLAKRALRQKSTQKIHLWTKEGRVGDGFEDFPSFMGWIQENYGRYKSDPSQWIFGVAVLQGEYSGDENEEYEDDYEEYDEYDE